MSRITIGIPCYTGSIEVETASGIIGSAGHWQQIIWMPGCCHIGIARDNIVHRFLESDAERLLFIDSDIVFGPPELKRIISHDRPIVAGLYALRREDGRMAFSGFQEGEVLIKDEIIDVPRAGTGFMCITRSAFEHIMSFHGDRWYDNSGESHYHFFPAQFVQDALNHKPVVQTDDFGFCDLARAAGLPIVVDLGCVVGHKGSKIFKPVFRDKVPA